MPSKWTNDERVRYANGHVSKSRVLVLEALEAQGKEGATMDELVALIGDEFDGSRPKGSIEQALHKFDPGIVVEHLGRWYLAECAPTSATNRRAPETIRPYQPTNGSPRPVTINGKRSEKQVSLYTSPRVFSDVISISLLIAQRWYRLPLFGSVRICIGFEAPNWSPDQEMFTDVEVIKIVHTGGKVTEERPAPKDLVTVAPEV